MISTPIYYFQESEQLIYSFVYVAVYLMNILNTIFLYFLREPKLPICPIYS